jgi:2'-5' RNA ligase
MRAFVGVPVPPERELVALLDGLHATRADLKAVEPGNLHMTLSFLGDVPDESASRIAEAAGRATRRHRAFRTPMRTVGAFPNVRRPRIIWAGAAEPEALTALALSMRDELQAAGFRGDDKDFRAHVTLARVRSERGLTELVRFLRDHGRDELPDLHVREARLYRSVLGPGGPTYETLAAMPLEA